MSLKRLHAHAQFPIGASQPVNGGAPPILAASLMFADGSCGGGGAFAAAFLADVTFDATHPAVTITKVELKTSTFYNVLIQPPEHMAGTVRLC